jgi:5-methylcytosine-specific restriction enzyme A
LEEEVWQEYANAPERLHRIAEQIRTDYQFAEPALTPEPDEEEFSEGRILFRLHRLRERKGAVIEQAKKAAKATTGKLSCCVCAFDFAEAYGELGEGYIEGHHTTPVSELEEVSSTKASDIALVCANCHRMLHRKLPWPTVSEVTSILKR